MKYTRIGNSDLEVSQLSLGAMSLERDQRLNAGIIHKAMDAGINLIDTADLYDRGWNEESIGKALKSQRQSMLISTKVGNEWNPDGEGWTWNPTKEYILKAVERSLRRLQTDYIDLYQLHGGTIEDPIDEAIEAFEQLKREGKIREYGISSIRPNVIRKWISDSSMVSVMMQHSLLDRRPEEECFSALEDAGVSVLARGSLAKGLLIDKPPKKYLGYSEKEVLALQRKLSEYPNPLGQGIGYPLSYPVVASVVIGIRTVEQLQQVLKEFGSEKDEYDDILRVLALNFYDQHR